MYRDCEMRSFFPLLQCQRNLILLFLRYKTLYRTHTHTQKNIREFHLYCWDHVCKVNGWCLVDCFHCGFKVSIQLMVRDYCIAKCKKFSTCSRLVMALWAIFFAIHNNNKLQHKCSFLETHFAMQVTIQKLLYHYLY